MTKQLSQNEFISLVIEKQFGIYLSEEQKKLLQFVKTQGVCIHMTKEAKNDQEFQRLINLLFQMCKNGDISSFQIVNE